MEILKLTLTALLSAVTLFVIAKILGHKQMSQLDFFDYITGITIGSIAAELATELEEPWKPLVAMIIYGIITFAITILTSKFPGSRKFFNGSPTIILNDGKLYRHNMKKSKLDLSDFMVMCRQAGYFNLNDIQMAIFEYKGRLTILPKSNKRPSRPADSGLFPKQEQIFTELIMDGKILAPNLHRLGVDETWLESQLKVHGYHSPKEIYLVVCDEDKNITFFDNNVDN